MPRPNPPVPGLAKIGAATILFGLLADAAVHAIAPGLHDAALLGFTVGEHLAHLVVLVGMVVTLIGIVVDGSRHQGRVSRPEGSPRDAVR